MHKNREIIRVEGKVSVSVRPLLDRDTKQQLGIDISNLGFDMSVQAIECKECVFSVEPRQKTLFLVERNQSGQEIRSTPLLKWDGDYLVFNRPYGRFEQTAYNCITEEIRGFGNLLPPEPLRWSTKHGDDRFEVRATLVSRVYYSPDLMEPAVHLGECPIVREDEQGVVIAQEMDGHPYTRISRDSVSGVPE